MGSVLAGIVFGFFGWFVLRWGLGGFFTVQQDQRAVKEVFGRAQRMAGMSVVDGPLGADLDEQERARDAWPQLVVYPPGGPYFKWPWERVHKVSVATQTHNLAWDPEDRTANHNGTMLDAVTKDQLDTGLKGQIRYRVSEQNLYAYVFGVKDPIVHVLGYFISVLRERIANYEAPRPATSDPTEAADAAEAVAVTGISINDLRKNLRDINDHMDRECGSAPARYGIQLDASLITEIDPPQDVEQALAAINTAHNHVSSEISLAEASADQKIVQSRKAVEIETLKAQAEVEPLVALAEQVTALRKSGEGALVAYIRNLKRGLFTRAGLTFMEMDR
jgi:regulator of protease activity HflC (stomatin/prohibitin superfamily)